MAANEELRALTGGELEIELAAELDEGIYSTKIFNPSDAHSTRIAYR